MVAKLHTELPFDFLIGHGESWLSGLYEAVLSFSRPRHAKAAIRPHQHKDCVTQSWSWLTCSPEFCHRGAGPAHRYGSVMGPVKGLWPKSRSAIQQSCKEYSYFYVQAERGFVLFQDLHYHGIGRTELCVFLKMCVTMAGISATCALLKTSACSAIQNSVWETQP